MCQLSTTDKSVNRIYDKNWKKVSYNFLELKLKFVYEHFRVDQATWKSHLKYERKLLFMLNSNFKLPTTCYVTGNSTPRCWKLIFTFVNVFFHGMPLKHSWNILLIVSTRILVILANLLVILADISATKQKRKTLKIINLFSY